jgi:predicted PurR-regulated permease PerM
MTTKTKTVVSIIIVLFWAVINSLIDFFTPVVSGVATAQQLNDTVEAYSMAKFIREGGLFNITGLISLIFLIIIWFVFSTTPNKK